MTRKRKKPYQIQALDFANEHGCFSIVDTMDPETGLITRTKHWQLDDGTWIGQVVSTHWGGGDERD